MKTLEKISLKNTRFGDLAVDCSEVVSFPEGLIGFPAERHFVMITTAEASSFVWLQSLTTSSLAFLLTDPTIYVANYNPGIYLEEQERIYTTVNIPHGKPQDMTLNLAGPISVNLASRSGRQIVLDHEAYTTKYRVFAQECHEQERAAA
jgi:flagellar assembly factor FliW